MKYFALAGIIIVIGILLYVTRDMEPPNFQNSLNSAGQQGGFDAAELSPERKAYLAADKVCTDAKKTLKYTSEHDWHCE